VEEVKPVEEVKTSYVRRPAWGNPDETREMFTISHKQAVVVETPKQEEPEKSEVKEPEYQPRKPHFKNKRRGRNPK
jgi:hypothetical protein